MRAKTLLIAFLVVFTLLFTLNLSWARGGSAERQRKQFQRIRGGVKSGEITRKEFKRLGREQRRIGESIRNARADGRVNARESRHIRKSQNRASKHITLATHNRAKPYFRLRPHLRRHGHKHLGHRPSYYCNRVHYGPRPRYYGYHFEGGYADPYYSFSWSIGWW
jgi:hypothetical protein